MGLSKVIKLDYSQVEQEEISVLDLTESPEKFIIFDLDDKVFCDTCHSKLTFKKLKSCVTLLCKCGCRIWYEQKKDGTRMTKFIPNKDYEGVKNGKK